MPFNTTPHINETPAVRIFFEGLLSLAPGKDDNKRCDVYALNHSYYHDLFVEVSVADPQPTFPFLRIGDRVKSKGLVIARQHSAGVTKYSPDDEDGPPYPFDDGLDFIDELHHDAKPNGMWHKPINIRDGVLYTVTRRDAEVALQSQNTACFERSRPLGLILGASIDLDDGEKLVLTCGQDTWELPRDEDRDEDDNDAKYIIWISNLRSVPAGAIHDPKHNDFRHYYDGFEPINDADKFWLSFGACEPKDRSNGGSRSAGPFTSPRVPCIPIVGGG